MDQFNLFVNFITQHWALSTLFGALLLVVIVNECMQRASSLPSISPQEAIQLINHKDAVVVDIRAEDLFAKGHIVHSINLPLNVLEARIHQLKQHTHHPLILVCANGQSLTQVVQRLKALGYTEIFVLQNGLEAWKQAALPLVKK
jgi:rhodanese-related sulfurtransferase